MLQSRSAPRRCFNNTTGGGLLDAVERLSGAGALDDIVEVVRTTARRLVGADGIAVVLREGSNCLYVEEDAVGPLWKGRKFPMTSCISGWAMLHGCTVIVPDIRADDRIPQDLYRQTFVRSLVMAPMPMHSAEPIGALGAYWAQVYRPAADDVETLQTLSRATATAIENTRLVTALSRALEEAELARDELRHRVKNAYTATQSLASLTLPPQHARAISARIAALARAHDLLDRKLAQQNHITLQELVDAELEPYFDAPGRVRITGEKVTLPSPQAIALGLAINELATNALKYGALSTSDGRLDVSWRMEFNYVVLEWSESDGPTVKCAAVESFGSRLLKRLVESQLAGSIRRHLNSSGVTCVLEFPTPEALGPVPACSRGIA